MKVVLDCEEGGIDKYMLQIPRVFSKSTTMQLALGSRAFRTEIAMDEGPRYKLLHKQRRDIMCSPPPSTDTALD